MMRPALRYAVVALWLLLIAASAWIVSRTPISNELTVFLPEQDQHAELLSQLRNGPASRLLLIALSGGPAEQLAQISQHMADQLSRNPLFTRVNNGAQNPDQQAYQWLFQQRYLLSPAITPEHFSEQNLRTVLQARLHELSSPLGLISKRLLPADPTGEINTLLTRWRDTAYSQQAIQQRYGVWFNADEQRALLVVQTRASGFDLAAQSEAVQAIEAAFAAAQIATQSSGFNNDSVELLLSGSGVFGVQAQTLIRAETERASLYASVLVILLLLLCFRSLRLLVLGALPLLTGILCAAASVGLLFGNLHAITLAFGITLLGVAIDYPIHVFSHLQPAQNTLSTLRQLWPTLRLSVMTTVVGYLAMATTSYGGLAQLGVFAIAGLLAAALSTRYGLPALLPTYWPVQYRPPAGLLSLLTIPKALALSLLGSSAVLVSALLYSATPTDIWENDIASLSPLPAHMITQDRELRASLGAPEAGQLIVLSGSDSETVLQNSEQLVAQLPSWIEAGYLQGFDAAVRYLPSQRSQAERQAALPDSDTLRARLAMALTDLPFKADVFEPFVQAVSNARHSPLIRVEMLENSTLGSRVAPLLLNAKNNKQNRWLALLPLVGVQQAQHIQTALAALNLPNARFVDLRAETSQIMVDFRSAALTRCLLGLLLMILLLAWLLRSWQRTLLILTPVLMAVLVSVAVLLILGQKLSLFHLVSLLLVLGLGIDYALFFNRQERTLEDRARTLFAILVCAGSTLTVFAIIASSQLPVLRAIGLTVVIGTCASFILGVLIARSRELAPLSDA